MSLSLSWRDLGPVTAVDIKGRSYMTDGAVVQQTVRQLLSGGQRQFIFNLTDLEYLSSVGLGQLIAAYVAVQDAGGDVKLVNPQKAIRELLAYTQLDGVLQVCETEADAIRSF